LGDPKESLSPLCVTIQIRSFLGTSGFCRISFPNYSFFAKPLYKATTGRTGTHGMGRGEKKAFQEIRRALTNAPALGLPDVIKPFFLYDMRDWEL
jgi:hypothetical protein